MKLSKAKSTQMAQFKITNKAVEDLSKIWEYTFEVWSKNQADIYYEMLIANCQEIVDNLDLRKNYDGIIQGLLGMKTTSHIIFYRTLNENYVDPEISGTRILPESMDLKKRIIE